MAKDPVCGAPVDQKKAHAQVLHEVKRRRRQAPEP